MRRITLFFFPHVGEAHNAQFKPDGRHRADEELFAWWPTRDLNELRGLPLCRVIVPRSVGEWVGDEDLHRKLNDAMRMAQALLRVEPKVWMEL